ncbi:MAG: class I SAM-dependent methyltransferase [Halolamina sp.]
MSDDPPTPSGGATQRRVVREGYDAIAADYDRRRAGDADRPHLDAFLDRLPADATVLDAGCGGGRPVLSRVDDRPDLRGVGLDFAETQLALARSRTDAALLAGDMTALPVADDAVDGITAFHSVIHVPEPAHSAVYREFARALRSDGHLLVSVGTDVFNGANDDWLDTGVRMEWAVPAPETARRQLRAAGFTLRASWTVDDELGGAVEFLLLER